jgi:1-acyl-sn-glycerol-3-phosphate acyltransferase
MVEKEHIYGYLLNGYNVKNSKLPMFIKKAYCKIAGPVLIWAMNSVEPIPVYRGTGREIIKTMKLTVEALEQEDNILLFPENNIKTERYTRLPGEFFTGFAHIGKEYFKKTGKNITFYPMYADSERRIIFMGAGITYDEKNHPANEKERIVEHLKKSMDEMAANGK